MWGTRLASVTKLLSWVGLMMALLNGCGHASSPDDKINLQVYQKWELQTGDTIGGHTVLAGLGDISIALNGKPVYAPFDGRAQQDQRECLVFSSPDVPAYLFRLCGLADLRLGSHSQGDEIGKGSILHVAALRKQPDGKWAIVEPSKPVLERILSKP